MAPSCFHIPSRSETKTVTPLSYSSTKAPLCQWAALILWYPQTGTARLIMQNSTEGGRARQMRTGRRYYLPRVPNYFSLSRRVGRRLVENYRKLCSRKFLCPNFKRVALATRQISKIWNSLIWTGSQATLVPKISVIRSAQLQEVSCEEGGGGEEGEGDF